MGGGDCQWFLGVGPALVERGWRPKEGSDEATATTMEARTGRREPVATRQHAVEEAQ